MYIYIYENSSLYWSELHRPSIKGTKVLFQVIKAINIIVIWVPAETSVRFAHSFDSILAYLDRDTGFWSSSAQRRILCSCVKQVCSTNLVTNFVVHYLCIQILWTVLAPSGTFIHIERLCFRHVWSMMKWSKLINREHSWLLTCKDQYLCKNQHMCKFVFRSLS